MELPEKRVVMVGFGSIGQALMPLLARHFAGLRVCILERDMTESRRAVCSQYGASFVEVAVQEENYRSVIGAKLRAGDFLLNLANCVSSADLIALAQSVGAFYLDTCIDPWSYETTTKGVSLSNYALREQILRLKDGSHGKSTAVVAHGANPGFVSILAKKGLLEMADFNALSIAPPSQPADWARLALALDVRVIQISEHDSQVSAVARLPGEFVSTWSVEGLVNECLQPGELGWGTHERRFPRNAHGHAHGCGAGICLDQPSFSVRMKSWSPDAGDFDAYMITHNEALSIADYLTLRTDGVPRYRPTVYYAYRPCQETIASFELIAHGGAASITSARILRDEIVTGMDELGVFLISARYPSLWIGSQLSIAKARSLAEHNNATSLQVVSSVAAAMAWMLEHPCEGILESESLDFESIFQFVEPYWSPMVREFVQWRPHARSTELQFQDFLVGKVPPLARHRSDDLSESLQRY